MAGERAIKPKSIEDLNPYQRLWALRTLIAIREGKINIPLVCGHCGSPSLHQLTEDGIPAVQCHQCGRLTRLTTAQKLRRQAIKAKIIEAGLNGDSNGD